MSVLAAGVLALAGCATPGAAPTATSTPDSLTGTITVFAAASLTDSFQQIADAFEREHPGVTVQLQFGGSSGLATQLQQGAPADVFAAASTATMKQVTDAGLASAPVPFATNTLELATPPGNPAGISALADLARPELAIALCAPEVPCGAAAAGVLSKAGITASVDTLEQDVKAVLTKVELGEVDAGLVYRTDVIAAGAKVTGVEFPEAASAPQTYPIAPLAAAPNPDAAAAFVAFVTSPAGRAILAAAGFGGP